MHTEHTLQTPTHFAAAATCLTLHASVIINKNSKMKMKK
jgi:hypothetical protein